MKIKYEFATGEVKDVEVDEEIGGLIIETRRRESSLARKERYHCYSMDAALYEGMDYASQENPEKAFEEKLHRCSIKEAFLQLTDAQQRRILLLAAGRSMQEIADMEGISKSAVCESIEAGRKKFKKIFRTP